MDLHPERWPETHGLVALVLAVGAVTAVVLLAVETILHPGAITDSEATVLSTVVGAIVGAVATYLGVSKANADAAAGPAGRGSSAGVVGDDTPAGGGPTDRGGVGE